jgi:hypothetical protein
VVARWTPCFVASAGIIGEQACGDCSSANTTSASAATQNPREETLEVLSIAEPIIINGEAVVFMTIFGNTLRLAFPDKDVRAANAAVAACRVLFSTFEGARAVWMRGDQ